MTGPWYITVAAAREFLAICGLPDETEGPLFDRAERELAALAEEVVAKKAVAKKVSVSGTVQYQAKATIRGKIVRLELYVRPDPRPEGPAPQLVRVRRK